MEDESDEELGNLTWLAGKWTRLEDVFPIKHGEIPASYVSLPEGKWEC